MSDPSDSAADPYAGIPDNIVRLLKAQQAAHDVMTEQLRSEHARMAADMKAENDRLAEQMRLTQLQLYQYTSNVGLNPAVNAPPLAMAAQLVQQSEIDTQSEPPAPKSEVAQLTAALSRLANQSVGGAKVDPPAIFTGKKPAMLHLWHRDIEIWMNASKTPISATHFLPNARDTLPTPTEAEYQRRIYMIATRLGDEAKQWFADNARELLAHDWEHFKAMQVKHYGLIAGSETAANALINNARRRHADFETHSQTFKALRARRLAANPQLQSDPELERCLYLASLPEPLLTYVNTVPMVGNDQPTVDKIDAHLRTILVRNPTLASQVGFNYNMSDPTPMDIGVTTSRGSRHVTVNMAPAAFNDPAAGPTPIPASYAEESAYDYTESDEAAEYAYYTDPIPTQPAFEHGDYSDVDPLVNAAFRRAPRGRGRARSQYSQMRSGSRAFPSPRPPYRPPGGRTAPRGGPRGRFSGRTGPSSSSSSYAPPFFAGYCRECGAWGHMGAQCPDRYRRVSGRTAMVHAVDVADPDDSEYLDPEFQAYMDSLPDSHFQQTQ